MSADFQVNGVSGNVQSVSFTATFKMSKDKKIIAVLRNTREKNPGVRLELEKTLQNRMSRVFLRAGNLNRDTRLESGVHICF